MGSYTVVRTGWSCLLGLAAKGFLYLSYSLLNFSLDLLRGLASCSAHYVIDLAANLFGLASSYILSSHGNLQ